MRIISAAAILLLLTSWAPAQAESVDNTEVDPFDLRDPIKPVNQGIFSFNLAADDYVVRPIALTYHHVPDVARLGIGNFLSNLSEPANCLNGILQLNPDVAFTGFWRFILNITFGLGGLRDFAGVDAGLKSKDTDFGKTLGSYGIGEGAYVVIPLLGPSTVRDATGKAVDWVIDPVGFFLTPTEGYIQTGADAIVERDEDTDIIDQFYYKSLEPYSATRAAYLQHEAFQ